MAINSHDFAPSLSTSYTILQNLGNAQEYDLKFLIDNDIDFDSNEPPLLEHSFYYENQNLVEPLATSTNFSILSLNCQSLHAKFSQLQIYVEYLHQRKCDFDVICLQETWLDAESDLSLLQLNNYNLISKGKYVSPHGGLAIYLKNSYTYKSVELEMVSDIWEAQHVAIEVKTRGPSSSLVHLLNIYRPPRDLSQNYIQFTDELSQTLSHFQHNNKTCIVAGDYNIDLLKVSRKPLFLDYINSIISNGFIPKITFPTRFSNQNGTLIDNFLCKIPNDRNITSGILTSQISDHQPYFLSFQCQSSQKISDKIATIVKRPDNFYDVLRQELTDCNLMTKINLEDHADPNQNYNILDKTVTELIDKYSTVKKIKFKKHKHKKSEWITDGIMKSIAFRDKLHMRLKQTSVQSDVYPTIKTNLATYNKILKSSIRSAKKLYYSKTFSQFRNDPKNTWKHINKLLNKSANNSTDIESLNVSGHPITAKRHIATELNKFFCNTGAAIASQIDESHTPFTSYLKENNVQTFEFQPVNQQIVSSVISELRSKSSAAEDSVSTTMLKNLKAELIEPLSVLINQSLSSGIFPDKLKKALVSPIHKKDSRSECANYRPISILPAISKVFEKIMLKQLTDHFDRNNLLFNYQYGFRKKSLY